MEPAHAFLPIEDWDDPAPPERANARLVLPGNECEKVIIGQSGGDAIPAEEAPEVPPVAAEPFQVEPTPPADEPAETTPVQTTPIVIEYGNVQLGTTIAPDNLDPNHPLPSVAIGRNIQPC